MMLPPIAGTQKITVHQMKLLDYLNGVPIFPVTLELDLTNVCNRSCPFCPSTTQTARYQL